MIIGCSGSGKSTLARALHERTGLPLVHLDQAYFSPGWVEPPQQQWRQTVTELAASERWVMDGNYSGTFKERIPRADTIIFLDFPTWHCLLRVGWRTLRFLGKTRPSTAPDCPERFDRKFLGYVMAYNRTRRAGILEQLETAAEAGKTVFRLSGPRAVRRFLKDFPR
jgi:adenylate kinase family enzyme